MKMKWVEIVAAGIVGAVILLLVLAGTSSRPPRAHAATAGDPSVDGEESVPANVTLVAPPTVHRGIRPSDRH